MRLKHAGCLLFASVLAGALEPARGLTTIYDSAGFESPRFTVGNLDGQDGGIWIEAGGGAAGTATVENTSADGGTQAVLISRTNSNANGGDKEYWPNLPVVTPTPAQNIINVNWDMNVTANTLPGVITGPFFGIEAYDPNVNLIAAAGVDATTGEILFADPALGGGFNNTTTDAIVTLGAWNHFQLSMNFTTDVADVYVNGVLKQVVPAFDASGITQFSDADLSTIATAGEPPPETGTARFDNYTVINTASVPEPSSMVGAPVAILWLFYRRRLRPRAAPLLPLHSTCAFTAPTVADAGRGSGRTFCTSST